MLIKMQVGEGYVGSLQVNITNEENFPVQDAIIRIASMEQPDSTIEELPTDVSGQTEEVSLDAPPVDYSLDAANTIRPYSEYNLEVIASGYETEIVNGVQILPGVLAIQNMKLRAEIEIERQEIFIPDHTLYGEFPPKIAESEIKPVNEPGEIVLSRVVVPEYVVVHDGVPTNAAANDYYVTYKDYIKNVASCEIYATWPESTLEANILAIMSFTMNRVYTEWYRNKGYNFTITSSTAFDQKWVYGRNIFEPISRIVDNIFDRYLSRPNVRQPILTQYCDGKRVTCPNWLSQWGSSDLGEQGYTAIEIIRNYYGDTMYINTAEQISGIPSSWPGYNLDIGASGPKVMQMQEQLDTIAQVYTAIPRIAADGIYGENTKAAVRAFQKIFGLPQTGITDFSTWYKISQIYVAIARLAEGIPRG